MKSDSGALVCWSAPVDERTRSSSISRKGRFRGREPVATMTWSAFSVRVSPSFSTSTTPLSPVRRPYPSTWVILFFLKSPPTPRLSCWATFWLRSCAGPRSKERLSALIPCFSPSFISLARRALVSMDLVGMHPTFRHTPPSFSSSTHATDIPS